MKSLLDVPVGVLALTVFMGITAFGQEAPARTEPFVPLDVCIFKAASDPDTAKLVEKFKDTSTRGWFFKSLTEIESIDDSEDCDVTVKLAAEKANGSLVGKAEVISGRTQRPLFHAEKTKGWGWGFGGELAGVVGDKLQHDKRIARELNGEKAALLTPEDASDEPTAAPNPKPAAISDVDEPGIRQAERPDDFAVVVGVEKYSNDLPDAQFSEHDAAAVKNRLLSLGYPERNVIFLSGQRATLSALASYVEEWLPRNVKDDSHVFFYFSGHGAPSESGDAYLVPWDGNPNFLTTTAYPIKKLYAQLGRLKAKQVIVALDSCFSGAGGRSVVSKGARPLMTKVNASVASDAHITLFTAASSTEITATLPDQRHGIFTYYFLKGLGGAAKDGNGVVTSRGLYEYLKPKVQDTAARQNRQQTPLLEGTSEGTLATYR